MIGYIRIFKPEMKYKEFLLYNAYYCGICKSLGDRYGLVYRNLINYDAVFISILLDSIEGSFASLENFRCVLHPLKKKYRCITSKNIDYAADLTVLMTQMKLKDNIIDDNDFLSKSIQVLLKKGFYKSAVNLGEIKNEIKKHLNNLQILENKKSSNIDEVSACYGSIIGEILKNGCIKSEYANDLKWIGFHLGKWIYMADAWTDMEEDEKKKSYNPFLTRFNYNSINFNIFKSNIKDRAEFLMMTSLDEITVAFDKIENIVNSGIIKNILYEGLFNLTKNLLDGETEKHGSEKSI